MGLGRQDRLFYEFCLDEVVPAEHLLRRIDAVLDLSWLRGELAPYSSHTGCRSSKPRRRRNSWRFSLLPATVCGMQTIIMILVDFLRVIVLSRATLQLENIALRQQVAVLKRERPRPWLGPLDRVFWIILSRLWPHWKDALVIVKPETVIGWHRQGFRVFWKRKSRHGKPGRPRTSKEIRELIQRMSRETPCGALLASTASY